jgi:hypothetical protein
LSIAAARQADEKMHRDGIQIVEEEEDISVFDEETPRQASMLAPVSMATAKSGNGNVSRSRSMSTRGRSASTVMAATLNLSG